MSGAAPPLPQSVVFNTFTSYAFPVVAVVVGISFPLSGARETCATPGNLDTEHPSPYCYELPTQLRLESVANAHTAADLHVRSWVSYRAGQESLGRRERINKYTKRDFYQSVIRRHCRTLLRCCNAAIAKLHTKFLNQRTESGKTSPCDNFRCTRKIF